MEHVAPDVMIIYLKLPANERLQFLAGQYIDILMKDGKRRSFSFANAPHDDDLLQLHVRNYRGGTFAEHVFTRMKERDILRFEGPFGTFFLREDSEKPLYSSPAAPVSLLSKVSLNTSFTGKRAQHIH